MALSSGPCKIAEEVLGRGAPPPQRFRDHGHQSKPSRRTLLGSAPVLQFVGFVRPCRGQRMLGGFGKQRGLQRARHCEVQRYRPETWAGLDDDVARPPARRLTEQAYSFTFCFDACRAASEETFISKRVVANGDVPSRPAPDRVVRSLRELLVAFRAPSFSRKDAPPYSQERSHREFSGGEPKACCPRGWGVQPSAGMRGLAWGAWGRTWGGL